MKKIIQLAIFAVISCTGVLHAATDIRRQMLVFQNTGKIDVFYTDEIESIDFSKMDANSVEHDEYVSQVFRTKDGAVTIIPLAEVDSVTFGTRKIITPKSGVRRLSEDEASAIVRFTPEQLTYRKGTPQELIVRQGETVYYDCISEVMPYGLCAKIKDVHLEESVIVADIDYVDPNEVFDTFIVSENELIVPQRALAPGDIFTFNLPESLINGCKAEAEAKLKATATVRDAVFDVIHHYYHGIVEIVISPYMKAVVSSEDINEASFETDPINILRVPIMGGIASLNLDVNGFFDIMAELGVEYEVNGEYVFTVEWTRKDGVDTFSRPAVFNHGVDWTNKVEAHLNGELFGGIKSSAYISLIFNALGAGFDVKLGPCVNADFSLGTLQKLSREYDAELYGNAKFDLGLKAKVESFVYSHDSFLLFGDPVRHKLPFEEELSIEVGSIDLFPDLKCRSTYGRSKEELVQSPSAPMAIDVASYTETDIDTPLETGFEIADAHTDAVVSRSLEEENVINPQSTELQTFSTEFPISGELDRVDTRNLVARPIFRYAGYIIKAPAVNIASDIILSPVVATMNANGMYMVSGLTPVSQSSQANTTFIEGNIVPYSSTNNPFKQERSFSVIDFGSTAGKDARDLLLGTWHGDIDGTDTELVFTDSQEGNINGISFKYSLNRPVTGAVSIKMDNGGTLTFYVTELTHDSLKIIGFKNNKKYFFTK